MANPEVVGAIAAMAVGSYACRAAGYFAMKYVRLTPTVEAALRALPIALVASVLAMAADRGGVPEWVGLAAAVSIMKWTRNELAASVSAVTAVALLRQIF